MWHTHPLMDYLSSSGWQKSVYLCWPTFRHSRECSEWPGRCGGCLWPASWTKRLHTNLGWPCYFTPDYRSMALKPYRWATSLTCPRSCNCWCCRLWTLGLAASPSSSFRPPFLFLCSSGWYFLTSCGRTLAGERDRNSKFCWDGFLNIDSANTIVNYAHSLTFT